VVSPDKPTLKWPQAALASPYTRYGAYAHTAICESRLQRLADVVVVNDPLTDPARARARSLHDGHRALQQ
jgi:hypothetical protein